MLSVWVFKSNQESWRGESLSLCIWRDGLQDKHTTLFKEITICAFLLCALWWLEVFPSQADDQLTQVNFYWGFWSIAQEVWSKKSGGMWHLISLAVRIKFKYPVGNVGSSVLFFVLINELFSCIDWECKLLCTLVQLNHSWRLSVVGQLSSASFFNCSVSLLDNERICLTGLCSLSSSWWALAEDRRQVSFVQNALEWFIRFLTKWQWSSFSLYTDWAQHSCSLLNNSRYGHWQITLFF